MRGPGWLMFVILAACARLPPTDDTSPDGHTDADIIVDDNTDPIRIVTWNVETLGSTDTPEWTAVRDVLARLDADVVGLNEVVTLDSNDLDDLAADLGYSTVVFPEENPFGGMRNAMLARLPVTRQEVWTSAALSGDAAAEDLTRLPVMVQVETGGAPVTVVVNHWKSGFYDVDEFRRAVDARRTAQAAASATAGHVVVMGDVNAEIEDGSDSPASFSDVPFDVPSYYRLGDDLYDELVAVGIENNAFEPLLELGLEVLDAAQPDGREGTRDESGRRIDYFMVSSDVAAASPLTEVYDSRDDADSALVLSGSAPDRDAHFDASDHFSLVLEFVP